MKLTRDELMERVKVYVGDRSDDETISFIEDISDTVSDNVVTDDWEAKYNAEVAAREELDASWRKRYRERFFGEGTPSGDIDETIIDPRDEVVNDPSPRTYEDLFVENHR